MCRVLASEAYQDSVEDRKNYIRKVILMLPERN